MTAGTVAMFCIGTSHTRDEPWTLMRALYDLTAAAEVKPSELATRRTAGDNRVLFDGPDLALSSNAKLKTDAVQATKFITRKKPDDVCLFGHSRGAVLAVMIAAHLYGADPSITVRLWLLDLVKKVDIGGWPELPNDVTSTVHPNASDVVRIVMGDETSNGLFPLEDVYVTGADGKVRLDHDHVDAGQDPAVTLHRLPGTHGSGTQVNPLTTPGEPLPEGDINDDEVTAGKLWPIGEVCLLNALHDMERWGVPLTAKGSSFVGSNRVDNLLRAYALLNSRHALLSDGSIMVNDIEGKITAKNLLPIGLSKPGYIQDNKPRKRARSPERLAKFGTDYRDNQMIVNDQHRELIEEAYGRDLAAQIVAAGAGVELTELPETRRRVRRRNRGRGAVDSALSTLAFQLEEI